MIDTNSMKGPPVLKAKDIAPAKTAVLTISSVVERKFTNDTKYEVMFEEFPENTYFPNRTSLRNLVDALGADETKWKGQRVVLQVVKTNDPRDNRPMDALHVAEAESWEDAFRRFDRTAKNPPAAAVKKGDEHLPKNAAKKTARRRS